MTPDAFHALALTLPGARFDIKFRGKSVYSVDGRMFASMDRASAPDPGYRFKASEMSFRVLVDSGLARPAPYLARASWVQLTGPDALPEAELAHYLRQAHALVRGKPRGGGGE